MKSIFSISLGMIFAIMMVHAQPGYYSSQVSPTGAYNLPEQQQQLIPSPNQKLRKATILLDSEAIIESVQQGANLHQVDKNGDTLLHIAARSDERDEQKIQHVFHYLVAKRMNINAVNRRGLTPLHVAVIKDNVVAAGSLIYFGADMNSAFQWCKRQKFDRPVCKFLRDKRGPSLLQRIFSPR